MGICLLGHSRCLGPTDSCKEIPFLGLFRYTLRRMQQRCGSHKAKDRQSEKSDPPGQTEELIKVI